MDGDTFVRKYHNLAAFVHPTDLHCIDDFDAGIVAHVRRHTAKQRPVPKREPVVWTPYQLQEQPPSTPEDLEPLIYMTPQGIDDSRLPWWYGRMLTPASWSPGMTLGPGRVWAADNEVFTGKFAPERFFPFLRTMAPYRVSCAFVTAPDVVADAVATLERYETYAGRIRDLGFPVAFVAQDGQESLPFPDNYDALFIGGSTEWKLSDAADRCIKQAKMSGKWIHVGRVNSQMRIRHFQLIGVDSVDGTTPCYAPNRNYRVLDAQLVQRPLFTV